MPAARGVLALAALVAATPIGCGDSRAPENPGVLLVVIDALRADHLRSYGYNLPTSPALDRLASEGERYDRAWAQSSWTLPAMASILTGRLPPAHGAGLDAAGSIVPIRAAVPTLAEHLAEAGFLTGAVTNGEFCAPRTGLARGFRSYDHLPGDGASNRGTRGARETTDAALAWLEGVGDRPYFLLVHYLDPHLTYDPPPPYDTMFQRGDTSLIREGFGSRAEVDAVRRGRVVLTAAGRRSLIARYDGEIRYVDDQIGRLREAMESAGLWDRTLVIVAGDHGEEFWDHGGFEHGHSHHSEILHVPLIVRRPGGPSGVRTERVRQIDIAPAILAYAGLPAPSAMPGRVLDGRGAPCAVAAGGLASGPLLSIRCDDGTLILDTASGARRFYSPADPKETRESRAEYLRPSNRLEDILRVLFDPLRPPALDLSDEQREILRTLGYVES